MVGRVNVKASQHNKKPIVVHIDRVLDFNASGSEKEQTENIHCSGIDLKAERKWARLNRKMKKKRNKRFSGTSVDGRQAHRSFILPLPQRGNP
jgi:hypothetical protein